jgi:hypothetical protein
LQPFLLYQICTLHTPEVGYPAATRSEREVAKVLRALAGFALIFAVIWLFFYEVQQRYPYLQTGSEVVNQVKLRRERTPHLFSKPNAMGVLLFGNSKALSGFIPDQFDAAMEAAGRPTESYNLGLPGYMLFVDRLEAILAAGNVPRYIFITVPWASDPAPANLFPPIRHDSKVMDELFPFRLMARDLMLAASSSLRHTGSLNFYQTNRALADRMLADRGYFFIYDLSSFPNNQLPANFKDPFDRPELVNARRATTSEKEFRKLNRLLETYHVTCLIVPQYYRISQLDLPPEQNLRLRGELEPYPRFKLVGPDYVRFENRYFSDSQHLNPDGARFYTRYIADLVAPYLR